MGYHIDKAEIDNKLTFQLVRFDEIVKELERIKTTLRAVYSKSVLSGKGADSLGTYIEATHVNVIELTEKALNAFAGVAAGFTKGLYAYDSGMDTVLDESYLTWVTEQMEKLSKYISEYHDAAKQQIVSFCSWEDVAEISSFNVATRESYVNYLDEERPQIEKLRDEVKAYDENYKAKFSEIRSWISTARSMAGKIISTRGAVGWGSGSALEFGISQQATFKKAMGDADQFLSDHKDELDENRAYYNTRTRLIYMKADSDKQLKFFKKLYYVGKATIHVAKDLVTGDGVAFVEDAVEFGDAWIYLIYDEENVVTESIEYAAADSTVLRYCIRGYHVISIKSHGKNLIKDYKNADKVYHNVIEGYKDIKGTIDDYSDAVEDVKDIRSDAVQIGVTRDISTLSKGIVDGDLPEDTVVLIDTSEYEDYGTWLNSHVAEEN